MMNSIVKLKKGMCDFHYSKRVAAEQDIRHGAKSSGGGCVRLM